MLADSDRFNWIVLLPVVAGGLAIWYLLPSTRRRPVQYGALLGILALAGLAGFLIRGFGDQMPQTVEAGLFFGFSGLAIVFAVLMITCRNPARSALSFALVVLSTCGLFLLLAAPFLAAATIVIYAGAIIVTFLFVIMLAQHEGPSNADLRSREPELATAAGFVLLATFLVGLQKVYDWSSVDAAIEHASKLVRAETIDPDYLSDGDPISPDNLGKPPPPLTPKADAFLTEMKAALNRAKVAAPGSMDESQLTDHELVQQVKRAIVFLEVSAFKFHDGDEIRGTCQTIADGLTRLKALREGGGIAGDVVVSGHGTVEPIDGGPRKLPSANVSAVGRTLFTDHLLAIELAGTLLLIATVGAIAIAGGRRERSP
jgi:NADH-quinone oxidoreductase subunit J